jgi:uracil-DNA glycosylase
VQFVAAEPRNPFGISPSCEPYVPGYGDPGADFHVVGDHPGIHGGVGTGIPFTGRPWSEQLGWALERAGLIDNRNDGAEVAPGRTFFSYLHMCLPDGQPTADDYAAMEPLFDAELRAVTAHVLLPVGASAVAHVLTNYTARDDAEADPDALHATELRGSGWLVVPVKQPAEWTDSDAGKLVDALVELRSTDYRRTSDLGRFFPGDDPYLVR